VADWEIRLPIRDRSEPLNAHAFSDLPNALPEDHEREMARQLLLEGRVEHGFGTVGEVADWLEKLDGPARRRVLNRLRQHVGLLTTAEVEQQQRFEAANENARLTSAKESPWRFCSAEGCNRIPLDEVTGAPVPTDVRRWWCRAHRDRAQPGDMESRPLRIRRAPSGALVEYDPDEEAREAAAEAHRAALREAEQAERDIEAQERLAVERAVEEQFARETPPGFPT
jgi:hypothetical protein